jgi:hypothetical protein
VITEMKFKNSEILPGLHIIQFFIIYVPSQQPKGQLQTQHSLDTGKTQALVEENNNNNNKFH